MSDEMKQVFVRAIGDMAIGAEFTFKMMYELCIASIPSFPQATVRKFIGIAIAVGSLSSWRIKGEKYLAYKKDEQLPWFKFNDELYRRNSEHYNTYKKPLNDAARVAKILAKQGMAVSQVENPDEIVGIKRGDLEAIKATITAQDAVILEHTKTTQTEKQLRGQVNLLQQEVESLRKSCTDKVDEIAELTRELRRRDAVKPPLAPADLSFFERRGRV
jgi:hypothetical protein